MSNKAVGLSALVLAVVVGGIVWMQEAKKNEAPQHGVRSEKINLRLRKCPVLPVWLHLPSLLLSRLHRALDTRFLKFLAHAME